MTKITANPGSSSSDPKGKGIAVEEQASPPKKKAPPAKKKIPTTAEYMAKLKHIAFLPTRYPHFQTLEDLGILADVDAIFGNLGLKHFFSLASVGYQSSACQFLASLKGTINMTEKDSRSLESLGKIDFTVAKKRYSMSFEVISALFGFEDNGALPGTFISIEKDHMRRLWGMISDQYYKTALQEI